MGVLGGGRFCVTPLCVGVCVFLCVFVCVFDSDQEVAICIYQNFWRFAPKIRRSEFCASRKIRQLLRFFKAYRRFAPVSVLLQICQLLRFKIIKINIVLLKDSFMKKVMYCQMAMLFLTGSVQNKPFMHCLYFYQLLGSLISKTNRAISTKF